MSDGHDTALDVANPLAEAPIVSTNPGAVSRDTNTDLANPPNPLADTVDEKAKAEAAAKAAAETPEAKAKVAADKVAAEAADKAEDAKLQEDLKSADPKVKADAEAKIKAKAETKQKALDAAGAPEKYEPFKMPEGISLDEAAVGRFLPVAKELELSQTRAQKLIDLYIAEKSADVKLSVENWAKTVGSWSEATKADKEIGGDKLPETHAQAKTFIKQFGTPALMTLLEEYKLHQNPEIVRMLAKGGRAISNDTLLLGGGAGQSEVQKSLAERLFGDTTPSTPQPRK